MYFGENDPNDYTVKVALEENTITLGSKSYVNVSNIIIEGFNTSLTTTTISTTTINNNRMSLTILLNYNGPSLKNVSVSSGEEVDLIFKKINDLLG